MSGNSVFISYSHRKGGPRWKTALLDSLRVFERHNLLDVWQDGKIRVSALWDDDIKQAMARAKVAVVLLTAEALDPHRPDNHRNYILNTELPYLRARQQDGQLVVFPVVCEECDWRAHDWLCAMQVPYACNPLSELTPQAQARVFRTLASEIAEEISRNALAELLRLGQTLAQSRAYLDKFPLVRDAGLRADELIGREQELALLDLALAQPHTAIASLVAPSGAGKSMLVQQWLRRLERNGWFVVRRIYAWSFSGQGTEEDGQDSFLAHGLEWFGVQCEPTLSACDRGRLLADAIAREPTLLILDGIEPLQYPPGPMGGQLRASGIRALLQQVARKAENSEFRGLCLVTAREPLTDLVDFRHRADASWGSVLQLNLEPHR